MAKREVKDWITVNGQHIPLYEGDTKDKAVARYIANKNEDTKNKQIAENQKQADDASGKKLVLKDNTDFKQFIKDNMPNPQFKEYGRQNHIEAVKELWRDKRAEEELKDVHEIKIEDAISKIRESIPEQTHSGWFRSANSDIKPKLVDYILSNKGTLNAGLNIAYHNYLGEMELQKIRGSKEKPLPFKEWLTTPMTMYRGEYGQKQVASDIFSAYTPDKKIAEKFGEKITEIKIRPIDTWGSYQTTAEQEYLVPNKRGRK